MNPFIRVASREEIAEGRGLTIRLDGREVALFRVGEAIHALDGRCPHRGASLGEGFIEDGRVFCPMHGWAFEIATGHCFDNSSKPARCLPVRVVNGQVEVQF
jgi:NAD(P)H-dependent nitrite reductase small subunit